MTGAEVTEARADLGIAWGLGRPLTGAELGRALGYTGRDPGRSVMRWEAMATIPGPAQVAIEMLLDGAKPRLWRLAIS